MSTQSEVNLSLKIKCFRYIFFECNDNDPIWSRYLENADGMCLQNLKTGLTVLVENSLKPFNVDQSSRIKRFGVFA